MNGKEHFLFRPLVKEHKLIFDQAFKENPPQISEFTFTNLFAWRDIYKFSFCSLDGFYIIRSDAAPQPRFFAPIGIQDVKKTIEKLLFDLQGTCIRIPEAMAALFRDDDRLVCILDQDNSDYLFSRQDLISLSGRKYDGKRNLIKKFKATYAYEYEMLNQEAVQECLAFQERWCEIRDCDKITSLRNERSAIIQILENFSDFALLGGALRINGRISALAVAEPLNPQTLVMHVLKANPDFTGLYQTITQEFLAHQSASFTYVNFEQDLGVEGLRKAKRSYHPVDMVRKYTLSRRQNQS